MIALIRDTQSPTFEHRKFPRRKVQMFATVQINGIPPISMHSLNISRSGLCMLQGSPPAGLTQEDAAKIEDNQWLLNQSIEMCFEIYPISVWGSIARITPDQQHYGIAITKTSDDMLWQSICVA